jgi:hypothetical protein
MCLAKDYSEQLLEIYNNINQEYESLNAELSKTDLYLQDILHMIENTNFNACDGYKFAKLIHDARIKRRKIKDELIPLMNFKMGFIDKNKRMLDDSYKSIIKTDNKLTTKTKNKTYTPKVLGVEKSESNITKPSFIPIPIPSTPVQLKEEPIVLGTAIHKTTKAKLQVISKIDDDHYVVKKKGYGLQVMLSKNIDNLEFAQTAK